MSTMKRPEMEVLRFKEADIIVASVATLSGFNDTESYNAKIHFQDKDYTTNNNDYFPYTSPMFVNDHGEGMVYGYLFQNDETGSPVDYDGTYHWNGSKFIKQ